VNISKGEAKKRERKIYL